MALAILLAGAALATVLLLEREPRLAGTNSVRPDAFVLGLNRGDVACQTNVLLPGDSAGVRVLVGSYGRPGPRLDATVRSASGAVLRSGSAVGYADGSWVDIRFAPVRQTAYAGAVCLRAGGRMAVAGQPDPNADNTSELRLGRRALAADLALRTMRPGSERLASVVPTIFHRASLLRPGWVGEWTYYALAALVLLLAVAAVALLSRLRDARPSLRWPVVAVSAIAFANAFAWSLVTPVFEPPDEASHYAYVESIVERGDLPLRSVAAGGEGSYTRGTAVAVDRTAVGVVQNRFGRPPWTEAEQRSIEDQIAQLGPAANDDGGGYTTAAQYSPLYYGLEAGPYALARHSSIFDRVWLMRLLSGLLVAASVAFVFLFARELFPTVSWAAPAAALVAAFEPMLAFMGGAVNNDNLLFLLASAELYLLARALRRGLHAPLALAIGAVLALGVAAKPSMYALVPVALLVVAWGLWRDRRPATEKLALGLAGAAAFGVLLALAYAIFPSGEPISGVASSTQSKAFRLSDFLSYTWQWYLPPLPFMADRFTGLPPVYGVFFKGFWADFGHLDTEFPSWVYALLAAGTALVVALLALGLYRLRRQRDRLASVLPPAVLCLLTVVGFALIVNLRAYLNLIQTGGPFAQGRYLLPAVGVLGAAVAAASLALGRRRGAVAATAFVTAIAVLNAFSLSLVLSRFYT